MKLLKDNTVGNIFLKGLSCSATPVIFSALSDKLDNTFIFILQDADEAGYLYHDLMQIINSDNVLFFPSGYKRAAKHGQRDSANEILRTEVLAKVASHNNTSDALFIVSYPDALAELVVSKKGLDERRLSLNNCSPSLTISGANLDSTGIGLMGSLFCAAALPAKLAAPTTQTIAELRRAAEKAFDSMGIRFFRIVSALYPG